MWDKVFLKFDLVPESLFVFFLGWMDLGEGSCGFGYFFNLNKLIIWII